MPDIFISPKKTAHLPKAPPSPPLVGLSQALSAYMYMPQGMHFETQEEGETIVLFLRKHVITQIIWIVISILLLILPFFLFPSLVLSGIIPAQIPYPLTSFFILVWYLITFSYLLSHFLLWYFTVSIVTNERVIDIDFVNLLNKKFAETRIARVEDVTMRTGGFIKAIFDFGDVLVQTAAHEQEFQFYSVPKPDKVVRIMNQLMGKEEQELEGNPI